MVRPRLTARAGPCYRVLRSGIAGLRRRGCGGLGQAEAGSAGGRPGVAAAAGGLVVDLAARREVRTSRSARASPPAGRPRVPCRHARPCSPPARGPATVAGASAAGSRASSPARINASICARTCSYGGVTPTGSTEMSIRSACRTRSGRSLRVYGFCSTRTSQLPELSRSTASTPYGRSDGSWMYSTPLATSSAKVLWQSSVARPTPCIEPFAMIRRIELGRLLVHRRPGQHQRQLELGVVGLVHGAPAEVRRA